jgi:hypothetical protein
MQNALVLLCRHLGIDKQLSGFYLGTLDDPVGADPAYRANGFLVDRDQPPELRSIIRSSPSLIELLHGAEHGSVEGYERVGERIVPVLSTDPLDVQQHRQVIGPIQRDALALVRSLLDPRHGRLRVSSPSADMVARVGLGWLADPPPHVATVLGALRIVSDVRGNVRSITGVDEFDPLFATGELLPDGSRAMWPAGRDAVRRAMQQQARPTGDDDASTSSVTRRTGPDRDRGAPGAAFRHR